MRVLFICSAKVWGGNEKWTSMAMAECQKLGHKVYFAGRRNELLERFGHVEKSIIVKFVNIFDLVTYYKLTKFIKENNIEVLVSTKKKEYFIAGIISRCLKLRHIMRLGIVRKILNNPLHWLVYRKLNDGIIVNAKRTMQVIRHTSFMEKHPVKLIYNGVKLIDIAKEPHEKFHILTSGMLIRRKGFHHLLNAFALLDNNKNIVIEIAGDGDYKEELQKLTEYGNIKDQVNFHGYMKELSPLMAKADLFVLLSKNEGISNSVLEAMAAGIPVFTTPSGGIEEFITSGENGFICYDIDPISVKKQLVEILALSSDHLKRIGTAGMQTVKEKFSLQRMGKETAEFLQGN